jgi:AcrR family transcriptional regulator
VPELPQHLAGAPIGRQRLSREQLLAFQREQVLSAATGVFAKRGYQQTTIDNIVTAAKGSVGSFYQRFEDKEHCFVGVFERIVDAGRARIAAAMEGSESWAEEAFLGLAELLAILVEEPLSARIVLIEAQTAGPGPTARYNELGDEAVAWLRRGRDEHPEAAMLPATFERSAVSGTAYFLHQRLLSSEPLSVDALLADTSQLILEPIVGAAELKRLGSALAASAAAS